MSKIKIGDRVRVKYPPEAEVRQVFDNGAVNVRFPNGTQRVFNAKDVEKIEPPLPTKVGTILKSTTRVARDRPFVWMRSERGWIEPSMRNMDSAYTDKELADWHDQCQYRWEEIDV